MYTFMSRHDRLAELCLQQALDGKFNCRAVLYPSEIKRIRKQWDVHVTQLELKARSNGTYLCLVSWDTAFTHQLDYLQSWYISGLSDEFPATEKFAQRLFLYSARNSK